MVSLVPSWMPTPTFGYTKLASEDDKGMKSDNQRKRVTSEPTWTATGTPGVEKKLRVAGSEPSGHEISILRLQPGARLPALHEGWGVEVVVLEGSWQLPEGTLEENGYSRRPPRRSGRGLDRHRMHPLSEVRPIRGR